eukprot:scaffold4121_cov104-Isochrysis_galbana.AAC.2
MAMTIRSAERIWRYRTPHAAAGSSATPLTQPTHIAAHGLTVRMRVAPEAVGVVQRCEHGERHTLSLLTPPPQSTRRTASRGQSAAAVGRRNLAQKTGSGAPVSPQELVFGPNSPRGRAAPAAVRVARPSGAAGPPSRRPRFRSRCTAAGRPPRTSSGGPTVVTAPPERQTSRAADQAASGPRPCPG